MGNPGCFHATHNKGNRASHVREPYTIITERVEQWKKEEEMRRRSEGREKRRKERELASERKKIEERIEKQRRCLLVEAKRNFKRGRKVAVLKR
eukprot:CAMPEP_0172493096 /NCGR_PEP_ID=MMETSP1066-20121228/24440_1 /TAXON_ID=671091 /ORGANISM="Coscinodiscus wailesii, Strain CCMP2513" /LENGTH=93 /DNA_ID=CAMNT_0013263077 /DNA_START=928 /DNA_END=1206 /DNA_ORIENTATION=+